MNFAKLFTAIPDTNKRMSVYDAIRKARLHAENSGDSAAVAHLEEVRTALENRDRVSFAVTFFGYALLLAFTADHIWSTNGLIDQLQTYRGS